VNKIIQYLEQVKEREEKATPGPWKFNDTACYYLYSESTKEPILTTRKVPYEWEVEWDATDTDILFIKKARTDVTVLREMVQEAVAVLCALKEMGNDYSEVKATEVLERINYIAEKGLEK
jgi:hypothetical protein